MKPGDVIAQRFQIDRLAGTGGMGAVYLARDLGTGSPVALKILHGHRLAEGERFAREAEVLAGLDHPAVVRYVAQGTTPDGEGFLAMEWLEGEPLSDRSSRGPLSLGETILVGCRLAEALDVAHRSGVIHRDLKPSNVILVGGNAAAAKLVDFGIARMTDRTQLTETGATMGTIGYMAPEQARGERQIDARADVFALGAVLFKCLTGHAPFEGAEPISVLLRQATEDAPRLRDVVEGIPAAVDDLVARMLARDPAERPPDAGTVLEELRRLGPIAPAAPLRVRAEALEPVPVSSAAIARTNSSLASPASQTLPSPTAPGQGKATRYLVAGLAGGLAVAGAIAAAVVLSSREPRGASVAAMRGECLALRCEPFDVPNPTSVNLQQLVPRIRAAAQSFDRSAELTSISNGSMTRNGVVDSTKEASVFSFRVAKREKSMLTVSLFRGQVSFKTFDTGAALAKVPDPHCPLPRVWAAAKARGAPADGVASFTYTMLGTTPAWSVYVTSPKSTSVTVRDSTCEAMF